MDGNDADDTHRLTRGGYYEKNNETYDRRGTVVYGLDALCLPVNPSLPFIYNPGR